MASIAPSIASRAQTAHEKLPAHSMTHSHRYTESTSSTKVNTPLRSRVGSTSNPTYQRFVLPDPVAFSYLEEDDSVTALDRNRTLQGYQTYVVEQWACSRAHPTFCITAYTGDSSHSVKVAILSVPADENTWSPRLRVYFQALIKYHARRRETPLGILMVTNLSGFPTSLTIVHVPDGDLRKHREDFVVNENLKRLGCSGRAGLTLTEPNSSTQAKFLQLYRTSDKISFYSSVIELVKLCQVALILFSLLDPEYADGLLCDITEKAITNWWVEIGTGLYNVEPNDGILGPITVAALLGTLMGAQNRLRAAGAPVGKDVFDLESTKRAIAYFQKNQRINKTRRLDRRTLDRLHRVTAKQASGDTWIVPRAVKSTVAELSGKGGEMVMEMVGGKNRANIAEIETIDIETFTQLAKGERAKWLWWGAPRKRTTRDLFAEATSTENLAILNDKAGDTTIPGRQNDATGEIPRPRSGTQNQRPTKPSPSSRRGSEGAEDMRQRRKVFDRAKGRIKGAVGLRPQDHTKMKDDGSVFGTNDHSVESLEQYEAPEDFSPTDVKKVDEYFTDPEKPDDGYDSTKDEPIFARVMTETPLDSTTRLQDQIPHDTSTSKEATLDAPVELSHTASAVTAEQSRAQSIADATDLGDARPIDDRPAQATSRLLRRSRSFSKFESDALEHRNPHFWPRHLSFGIASEAILSNRDAFCPEIYASTTSATPSTALHDLHLRANAARTLRASIASLGAGPATWVTAALDTIEGLQAMAAQDAEQLWSYYQPRKDEYGELARGTAAVVREEQERLQDAVKDVEGARAKLDYEIAGLRSRVEDVETAVAEFERKVLFAEGRVEELVSCGEGRKRAGWGWFSRLFWRENCEEGEVDGVADQEKEVSS